MKTSKRQILPPQGDSATPGTLWVVATPIGNLEDISQRAKSVLEQAHTVLCEDTRQGAKLIQALGLSKSISRLERLDAHATEKSLQSVVSRLEAGESFALITDAGTPAISDPGSTLVKIASERGIVTVPVPGPSAVPTLLSVAGFEETFFIFRGFFPRNSKDQAQELDLAGRCPLSRVFVWFESPHRIQDALSQVAQACPEALVAAAKELTKLHESIFRGSALEVAQAVEEELQNEGARGEWVFAVRFPKLASESDEQGSSKNRVSEESIKALHCLIDAGVSASEAARQVSHHFGAHKKSIYDAALKIAGKTNDKNSEKK